MRKPTRIAFPRAIYIFFLINVQLHKIYIYMYIYIYIYIQFYVSELNKQVFFFVLMKNKHVLGLVF
ncbi:MAG: hypothetical protein N7Q72_07320, partial [Spiroplasma sp. Tabriz.8]|nr:hypothetical protein [Spiroplasma sp. Tabriz.8]